MGNSLGDLGSQAKEVFRHFPIQRVGAVQPQPGTHPQLITGRICCFGRYFMAPLNGIPCVYHETVATEDVDNGQVRINEGNTYVDFCIGDPASPNDFLYIPASTAKVVLIRAEAVTRTTGHEMFIDKPIPPNIQVLADRHNFQLSVPGAVFGHTLKPMTFTESSLDVNEQITVLGIITIGPGPGGFPVKILQPMTVNMLNEEYFNLTGWSSLDRKCWSSLMSDQPSFIIGDAPYLFQNHTIAATNYVVPAGGQIYAMPSQGVHMQTPIQPGGQPMMMVQPGGQPMVMMQQQPGGQPNQNQPVLMQGAPGRYGGSGGLQPQGYYPSGQPQYQSQSQPMNHYPPGHPNYNAHGGVGKAGGASTMGAVPAGAVGVAVGLMSHEAPSAIAGLHVAGNEAMHVGGEIGGELQQGWQNAQPGLIEAGQTAQGAAQWTGQEMTQGYQASQPFMSEVGQSAQGGVQYAGQEIQQGYQASQPFVSEQWGNAQPYLTQAGQSAQGAVQYAGQEMNQGYQASQPFVSEQWGNAQPGLMQAGQTAQGAAQWAGQEMTQGYEASQPFMSEVGNFVSEDGNMVANAAASLFGGLGDLFS